MRSSAAPNAVGGPLPPAGAPLRVAFVGSEEWVEGCAPAASVHGLITARLGSAGAADPGRIGAALAAFRPHATVIFDPPSWPLEGRRESLGVTLGVLVSGAADEDALRDIGHLDRLVCFDPALTGARIGAHEVWRAIPPPVSDALFGKVRPLHHAPRAMAIGRSSAHREAMLMPAKHHHDLLQIIHGVSGQSLRELLDEHDVGVYFSPEPGGGFGQQAGVHLAAGHLLLAEQLTPEHGLERNIDYLQIDSPEELVWVLDRLGRFPEMHHRIRIRGRLKAEQYRASRLFGRLVHDLLFDLAAFGSRAGAAS